MKSKDATLMKKARSSAAVAILVAVSLVGISFPSYAQGLSAGQTGLLDQSRGLNPDQDSLLPPAVIPVDPAATKKHVGVQPGEIDLEVSSNSVKSQRAVSPQHMNMHPATSGLTSARDRRQALMNSLMQKGNTSQLNTPYAFNPNVGLNAANTNNQFAQQQLAQPNWLAPQARQVPAYGSVGQTQTLTASSRHPIVRRDTRRGGLANNISGALSFGTGLFTGGLKRPNSLFGLGSAALFSTGIGKR